MKYTLKTTKQYAKQLKKCIKRGFDATKLEAVVDCLVEGHALPENIIHIASLPSLVIAGNVILRRIGFFFGNTMTMI